MYKQLFAFFASALLACGSAQAQPAAPKLINSVEGMKEYELENGLRVLLIPDGAETNLAVNIIYKVGSRHEGYGESGMAHLLEHMLFKQCGKFTDIKKAIADKGAFANGTTWYDRTNYYEILSASDDNLKWALDMEADRMVNSKILAEELQKEFSVVRNEFEIGENNPSGVLNERVLSSMYLWHNYGKSTIGSKEDIERVQAANLKNFYKKYYQPDNAELIIAGKFDEKQALEYVKQFFGPIPRPTRVLQPTYTMEPAQDGERFVTLSRTGDIQYIGMGYHTPSFADKDYAANDALIQVLTNDPSGVFYKKLVESKLATRISGYAQTLHDPGFTYFEAEVPKDKSIDSARAALIQSANAIGTMKFTEEDLSRAKNVLLKYVDQTNSKVLNLSIGMAEFVGAGDWRLWFLYRDRVEALTLQDLQSAAQRYYKPSNRTVGVFIPDAAPDRTVVNETPDIDKLVEGYKGKAMEAQKAEFENSIDNIKKNTVYGKLANGGKYALLEKPTKGDKITATFTLRAGEESNLMNKQELSDLAARMLMTGTTTRSKKQIMDELDKLKSDISFSGGPGALQINMNTDKQNLAAALSLLDDLLHHPKFDAAEFDKEVQSMKAGYEANKSEPQTVAQIRLGKLSTPYPKGHPLYTNDADESLAEINKIKLDDVKKYYAEYYGANNSTSVFVGQLDQPKITGFLNRSLGKWNAKMAYKRLEPKYFDVAGTTESVNTPDKTNAVLMGSINLNISQQNNDYPAVFMADNLLGGGAFLSSRIPQRLREKEGMSYGAGTYMGLQYKYNVGTWGVYAFYNPLYQGRIDTALHEEIEKAKTAGFTQEELTNAVKAYLEGNKTTLGVNGAVANLIQQYMRDDRDLTQYTDFENKVKAIDLNKVNDAMKKYFNTSKLILIFSGDFKKKAF